MELKDTINTMVDQLRSFASEVTRVAREVGTEGKLGGQAEVEGVAGTWKDLTDSVNSMAGNLTSQVRNIADVTTAVAKGDLSKRLVVEAKGLMPSERRRTGPGVDDHVEDRAVGAADQLGLTRAAATVQPAQRPAPRSGL